MKEPTQEQKEIKVYIETTVTTKVPHTVSVKQLEDELAEALQTKSNAEALISYIEEKLALAKIEAVKDINIKADATVPIES
jgi:hypothetical protein